MFIGGQFAHNGGGTCARLQIARLVEGGRRYAAARPGPFILGISAGPGRDLIYLFTEAYETGMRLCPGGHLVMPGLKMADKFWVVVGRLGGPAHDLRQRRRGHTETVAGPIFPVFTALTLAFAERTG